ncbi:hypothetical protein BC830DRAFT_1168020 [Chytriomyces sp. MP71]|nr:hypothetical protein BC830DRAFT_1168020 [Chytriomyces sp. MP71]
MFLFPTTRLTVPRFMVIPYRIIRWRTLPFQQVQFVTNNASIQNLQSKLLQAKLSLDALPKPATAPPKKPISAFLLYCSDTRRGVAAEVLFSAMDRGERARAVTRELGKRWRAMEEEEKERYKDEALHRRKVHEREMDAYRATASPEDAVLHAMRHALERDLRSATRQLVAAETPGYPGERPLSAWVVYMKSVDGFNVEGENAFKAGWGAWNALSEEEKKPFVDEAARLSDAYKAAVEAWKESEQITTAASISVPKVSSSLQSVIKLLNKKNKKLGLV